MGFAFCSGYGHYRSYETGQPIQLKKRIATLYGKYLIVLVTVCIVSVVFSKGNLVPGNITDFVMNALLLNTTYNASWWYLPVYIILLLCSTILYQIIETKRYRYILCVSVIVYAFGYYLRYVAKGNIWFFSLLGKLAMTQFEYILGMLFAATNMMSVIVSALDNSVLCSKFLRRMLILFANGVLSLK